MKRARAHRMPVTRLGKPLVLGMGAVLLANVLLIFVGKHLPVRTVAWLKLIGNPLFSGIGFSMGAHVFFSLLREKDIGHRLLLWLTVLFCGDRAFANLLAAYQGFTGHATPLATSVYLLGGLSSIAFSCHLLASKDDMLTTLRTSEVEDRRRRDKADDLAQQRMNLAYIDTMTMQQTQELVRRGEADAQERNQRRMQDEATLVSIECGGKP